MKITLLTQYFTPEIGATQTRMHTIAAGLAAMGHEVSVICEVPNHPHGIVHPEYRGRPFVRRRRDGFDTVHLWVRATPEKTTRSRLELYGSYAVAASAMGMALSRPDVIFASSPPLFVAAAAAAIARRHRVPWVMDVRDLWPAAAVALGELGNARALELARRLERWLYRDAAAITVVTEPFRGHVHRRLGTDGDVMLIPNGTTQRWVQGAEIDVDRAELDLASGEFLWLFAGNIGAAQGLDAAVRAAAILGRGFRLLILGDGPARGPLEALAAQADSGCVEFRGQVSPDLAVRYLRSADSLLVSLSNHPLLESFVPSKLYDCCAVGRPVVLAARGEARRLASEHGAALAVDPGDPQALAGAIRELAQDAAMRERLAVAGRRFGADNLRDRHVEQLATLLERVSLERKRRRW